MNKIFIFLLLAIFAACTSPKKNQEVALLDSLDRIDIQGPLITEGKLNEIINQIPAPIELSSLLKTSGARYDKAYLADPENYSRYNSAFDKALNLGIYGTDLGFSNLYEENQQSILYMGAVKELVDDLRIDQFFDFHLIERLSENRDLDSLLLITTQNFNEINVFFQEQERAGLSALIISGGWLEAVHVALMVHSHNTENYALREKIGSQKIVLEHVVSLLEYFKDASDDFGKLYADMLSIQKIFDEVKIEKIEADPTYEEVNGVLVAKDNNITTITISEKTVNALQERIDKIRLEITG